MKRKIIFIDSKGNRQELTTDYPDGVYKQIRKQGLKLVEDQEVK
jgi:hypothetical protein